MEDCPICHESAAQLVIRQVGDRMIVIDCGRCLPPFMVVPEEPMPVSAGQTDYCSSRDSGE